MKVDLHWAVLTVLLACRDVSGTCLSPGCGNLVDQLIHKSCPFGFHWNRAPDVRRTFSISSEGPITSELVDESLRCGREVSVASSRRGLELVNSGVALEETAPGIYSFFDNKLPPVDREAVQFSHELLTAVKIMQNKMCSSSDVTPNTFLSFLEQQDVRVNDGASYRRRHTSCDRMMPYRSIDGTCNNLRSPLWGKAGAPFTRIAKPRYADGIHAPPLSTRGAELPAARLLSTRIFADRPVTSLVFNYLNIQWGQLITHDMIMRVMEHTSAGGIQCCQPEGCDILPPHLLNDACYPIMVPADDPFYSQYGVRCLNFVRSVTTPSLESNLGFANQMNGVTSFLDGSVIYGNNAKLAFGIRSKVGGKMREEFTRGHSKGFLPKANEGSSDDGSETSYIGGDGRMNQSPPLAMLHTLMVREHNRVADILARINPFWTDERLYQEARRIVIAELQHITYQEWLTSNLGENYIKYFKITPNSLYTSDYDEDVNPGIINGFGAGAFRYLHSTIPDAFQFCPASYQGAVQLKLSDHLQNAKILESTPDAFDSVVRGCLRQNAGEPDPYCTSEVTNKLFKSPRPWGLDLLAIDIQRGRDHGLASYNTYRNICGLPRANTFRDLVQEISPDRIAVLEHLYDSVDDIDLLVGGTLEARVPGSVLGHTFQCIVAEQFYRTRVGDRFFYDNVDLPHSFSFDQLRELKKVTMARLICDNTESIDYVQKRAFELESQHNPLFSCYDYQNIPAVDFTPWRHF